uniref:Phospholipid phosphatase related 2 n=1 Tax=Aquila chrysaetos chrysaetos TaxID=223781 RepID=A0A663FF86_AQUCH
MRPPRGGVKRSGSIVPASLFLRLGILGGTAALAYQLEFTDAFPVHDGGFFCRDPAYGRAPPALVYALVTAVPVLTVSGLGGGRGGTPAGAAGGGPGGLAATNTWGRVALPWSPLRRLLRFLGVVFSFGLLATAIFANAGQVVTGAPAPHFLAVCRPNYSALGCAPPRRTPPAFPCKEAALGAYAGAYAGLYVTLAWRGGGARGWPSRRRFWGSRPPRFLLGALRVAEHRNHWGDVLAGFLTGTAIAVTCVVGNFQSTGESGQGVGGGVPRAPPELPHPQPPLEEISVTQVGGGHPKTGGGGAQKGS